MMEQQSFISSIGVVAAAVLPLFNIPLIIRIVKRKSSEDISLSWAVGGVGVHSLDGPVRVYFTGCRMAHV